PISVPGMLLERRGKRFRVQWPVQYRQMGTSSWTPAQTMNLSTSGLLLRASHPPPPATCIEVRAVVAPPSPLPPTIIRVTGRVVRSESAALGIAAIEFESPIRWNSADPTPLIH